MQANLESLLQGQSLWGAIQSIENFAFFTDNAPDKLDRLQLLHYGEKPLFNKMVGKSINELAESIVLVYRDSWTKLIEANLSDINIGSENTKVINETIDDLETKTNTKTDTNKVSAYNSEELVNDGGAESNGTDTLDGKQTRIYTESNLNLNMLYANLSLLAKTNIINTVLKDASCYLTLDIY